MARTVQTNLTIPEEYAIAKNEVIDTADPAKGIAAIWHSINGLYEKKRSNVVNDASRIGYSSEAIVSATGAASNVAQYFGSILGKGDLTTENIEVWVYITTTGSGNYTLRARTYSPRGGLLDTATRTLSSTGSGMIDITNVNKLWWSDYVADDYGYLYVDVSACDATRNVYIYTISAYYERAKAALDAGVYLNGFIPMEMAQADGEKPVSVCRLHHMHADLRYLYEDRVGLIVSSWFERSGQRQDDVFFLGTPPAGVTEARVYLYVAFTSGLPAPGQPVGSIRSNDELITLVSGTDTGIGWFGEYDLDVTPGESQAFAVTTSTGTGTVAFGGVCAWWLPGAY